MTLDQLRQLYHDGTINRKGKSELKTEFMRQFHYATTQQFVMKMAIGSHDFPTPNQFAWLQEVVVRYHNHYSGQEATPTQLSIDQAA